MRRSAAKGARSLVKSSGTALEGTQLATGGLSEGAAPTNQAWPTDTRSTNKSWTSSDSCATAVTDVPSAQSVTTSVSQATGTALPCAVASAVASAVVSAVASTVVSAIATAEAATPPDDSSSDATAEAPTDAAMVKQTTALDFLRLVLIASEHKARHSGERGNDEQLHFNR